MARRYALQGAPPEPNLSAGGVRITQSSQTEAPCPTHAATHTALDSTLLGNPWAEREVRRVLHLIDSATSQATQAAVQRAGPSQEQIP